MLRAPVVIVPPPIEWWRIDGAQHSFIVHGCGGIWRKAGRLQVLGLQGAGIVRGRFLYLVEDAQEMIDTFESISEAVDAVYAARGGIALQIYDVNEKAIFFLNDPLGAAPIYCYQEEKSSAFSSDLGSLVTSLKSRGEHLRRDPRYFAFGTLTGTNGCGSSTPYKEITVLPRGLGIKISADGQIQKLDTGVRHSIYVQEGTYGNALQTLSSDILDNVRITSSCDFQGKYAHLTGGFDSRLVLAAIKNQKVDREIIFTCLPNSSDWQLANRLASEFELTFSGFEGNKRGSGYAQNYYEYLTRSTRNSFGAIVRGIEPSYIPADTLLFQGGYGEVMRTFNSFKWDGPYQDSYQLAYTLWRWASFPDAKSVQNSIWSQTFIDHSVGLLEQHLKAAAEIGIPQDAFTNYFYVEARNRYWIGLQSFYANRYRTQFDPLYSVRCVSLPLMLPFYERKANFVGLDLMRMFEPRLMEYPFDRPRISELYEKSRGNITRRDFSDKAPNVLEINPRITSPRPWPGPVDVITAEDKEVAKTLGISAMLIAGVRKYGKNAVDIVSSSDELLNIYNHNNLRSLWNNGDVKDKQGFAVLDSVIATLFLSEYLHE